MNKMIIHNIFCRCDPPVVRISPLFKVIGNGE